MHEDDKAAMVLTSLKTMKAAKKPCHHGVKCKNKNCPSGAAEVQPQKTSQNKSRKKAQKMRDGFLV